MQAWEFEEQHGRIHVQPGFSQGHRRGVPEQAAVLERAARLMICTPCVSLPSPHTDPRLVKDLWAWHCMDQPWYFATHWILP